MRNAEQVRDALVRQWRAIGREAPSRDLDKPSRIDGWRNREVLAHLTMQPVLLVRFLATASAQAPQLDLAENLAGTRNLAELVDTAAREAASAGNVDFAARAEEAIAALAHADLAATVTTIQGPIVLGDYLVTRCVEAVVHGSDLVDPVAPDPDALRIAARALVSLLEKQHPSLVFAAQTMDSATWLAAATGREPAPPGFETVLPLMA
jgi:hypothetical protein